MVSRARLIFLQELDRLSKRYYLYLFVVTTIQVDEDSNDEKKAERQ